MGRSGAQRAAMYAIVIGITVLAAAQVPRDTPHPLDGGGALLPNGWQLTPAGEHIPVGDLPLSMALGPDGATLLVLNNGYGPHGISVVDTATRAVRETVPLDRAWLGLAISARGEVFVSGGASNTIRRFRVAGGRLESQGVITLGRRDANIFPAGLALDPAGTRLYVVNNLGASVSAIDLASGRVTATVPAGTYPYTCAVSPDGRRLVVSNWGDGTVGVFSLPQLALLDRIRVGDHPNALLFDGAGARLFVANANSNSVSVVDVAARRVIETVNVALTPRAPEGSTSNALALSPDERTLFVANADNNCVAVVDVGERGATRVAGFIPTGWYPTAVQVSRDGRTLYVANGKGTSGSAANPRGPTPLTPHDPVSQYTGGMFTGTLSFIPVPGPDVLAQLTRQTLANSPYRDEILLAPRHAPAGPNAIPSRVGDPSPIRFVIYVIKENRTYDQVFGDLPQGNGDPSLCLFPEENTPNHHALAREFVLFDNLYADAEVSADGHNWSNGAYATDYVEKTWPTNYSHRGRVYDFEGIAEVVFPSAGYLWDACARGGVSYRSYGEFVVRGKTPGSPAYTRVRSLQDHFDPAYRPWDTDYPDVKRLDEFTKELRRFEAEGDMPRFQVLRLGNDHTVGGAAGSLTPRAMVGDNDLALGRLVDAVSHSRFWPATAIFVIEDDAQNGADHVDAHRTVALAVSPYIKRGTVDSTMYSTTSLVRTMELILGLPPMSQFDAASTPLYNAFTALPDPRPYTARPARVPLEERNPPSGALADEAVRFDFSEPDRAPDLAFARHLWRVVRGVEMPPPVRSAFAGRPPAR